MPQIDKFLLAQALALGLDAPEEIRIVYRQGNERRWVKYDGLKVKQDANQDDAGGDITPTEDAILNALEKTDKKPTGPQLAKECGLPCNAHFRRALARLVKAELIINHNPGYSIGG